MYGLELMKILKARGKEKLSPGLLYPTLNRLEEMGLLESREEKREGVGATRKIYRTTRRGLDAIFMGVGPITDFVDFLLWEESAELREEIYRDCELKEGQIVVDFSNNLEDLIAIDIGHYVGKTGKVFFHVRDLEQIKILENHINAHNLKNIVIPLDVHPKEYSKTSSADIAINIMSLHEEPDPQGIIKAMQAVVKENGRVVVADLHKIDHIFANLLQRLAPHHRTMGLSEEDLTKYFDNAGLETTRIRKEKGIIIIIGTKT